MLRFSVFSNGRPAESVDLSGAYLVGADNVPLRADIEFRNGEILCEKRIAGPAALAVLWPVSGVGILLLETTRLPERDKPYVLQVELLRSRLMRIEHKIEEWQQYDPSEGTEYNGVVSQCRSALVQALQADAPADAATIGDRGLTDAVTAAENMTLRRAGNLLQRRKRHAGGFPHRLFGCSVELGRTTEGYRKRLIGAFDYATIQFSWQAIQPGEKELDWSAGDAWVEWFGKHRVPIRGGSLVSFTERSIPPWLYVWEHDFETIRDLVYEHVRRVVDRYAGRISAWDVVSGIHADNCLSFNFEQLMELTRMSVALTKQIAPRSVVAIDLVAPWGEYYARNQRTIPPLLYADMAVQSGINFDAFGLQFCFGMGVDGMYVRDMFQISALLDRFAALGKPLHVTAVQVPSSVERDGDDAWGGEMSPKSGGIWHEEWNEQIQSRWLRSFYEIALSKPVVESITWRDLADQSRHYLPNGGLLRADLSPKPAYEQLRAMRKALQGNGHGAVRASASESVGY